MKKNGVFLFVISHLVPEIFKIFVLCKLGTDDIIRCDNMKVNPFNTTTLLIRPIFHGLEVVVLIWFHCRSYIIGLYLYR